MVEPRLPASTSPDAARGLEQGFAGVPGEFLALGCRAVTRMALFWRSTFALACTAE